MKCKKCGAETKEGSKFCMVCGAKIEETEKNNSGGEGGSTSENHGEKKNGNKVLEKIGKIITGVLSLISVIMLIGAFFGAFDKNPVPFIVFMAGPSACKQRHNQTLSIPLQRTGITVTGFCREAGFSRNSSIHLIQQCVVIIAVEHVFLFQIPEGIGPRLRHCEKLGGFR